jgi:hypothetical protein
MGEQSKRGRKPRVTDEEVLSVLRESDDPVLSTAEVADELPIKRRATLTRLRRLAEGGVLTRKQTGGRNTIWWLADEGVSPKTRLKRLSNELDEPVAVAGQVYESGDEHTFDGEDADWREGYGSWTGSALTGTVERRGGDSPNSSPDDRTAVDERKREDVLDALETFLAEQNVPETPPSAAAVRDDYHAHRHRENLERLAGSDEGE